MFTGIVQTFTEISQIIEKPNLISFSLTLPKEFLVGLKQGASVAVDGVCLTVTDVENQQVWFDAMTETLQRTTIGSLKPGQSVNIERSFKVGDEVGGHIISGHVHGTVQIINVDTSIPNNHILTFKMPHHLMKYLFSKGYVALNGVSLTLVDVDKANDSFTVYLIPETLKRTTFSAKREGELVNIEIDSQTQTVVETVERILAEKNLV
jgi:riboflavin synthase